MTEYQLERESLLETVLNGYTVEFGLISLCCINQYYHGPMDEIQFQVHCGHHKGYGSELFERVVKAVDRFLELKRLCYGRKS